MEFPWKVLGQAITTTSLCSNEHMSKASPSPASLKVRIREHRIYSLVRISKTTEGSEHKKVLVIIWVTANASTELDGALNPIREKILILQSWILLFPQSRRHTDTLSGWSSISNEPKLNQTKYAFIKENVVLMLTKCLCEVVSRDKQIMRAQSW